MNVEILEVGLEREFSFLDRKKKLQKKMFCRPTDPKVFSQWTRNRGTFFWPNRDVGCQKSRSYHISFLYNRARDLSLDFRG